MAFTEAALRRPVASNWTPARPAQRETDLYPPIKAFLAGQGHAVEGEVQDCDVVTVRGEEPPAVVEFK